MSLLSLLKFSIITYSYCYNLWRSISDESERLHDRIPVLKDKPELNSSYKTECNCSPFLIVSYCSPSHRYCAQSHNEQQNTASTSPPQEKPIRFTKNLFLVILIPQCLKPNILTYLNQSINSLSRIMYLQPFTKFKELPRSERSQKKFTTN